jgi:hypothetical protein
MRSGKRLPCNSSRDEFRKTIAGGLGPMDVHDCQQVKKGATRFEPGCERNHKLSKKSRRAYIHGGHNYYPPKRTAGGPGPPAVRFPRTQPAAQPCAVPRRLPPPRKVDHPYGRTMLVVPAVDRLPASSIAITVTTLSPATPYALGVMFVPTALFSCRPFT